MRLDPPLHNEKFWETIIFGGADNYSKYNYQMNDADFKMHKTRHPNLL